MMRSMTGFVCQNIAVEVDSGEQCMISISLKSLNSRFFEVTCKTPHALSQYETDFIKILKPSLLRGHVYLTIHTSKPSLFNGQITADTQLVQAYLNAVNNIKNINQIAGELTIDNLVNLPGVFSSTENLIDSQIKDQIFQTVQQLCLALNQERAREGASLQAELLKITQLMQTNLQTIEIEFQRSFEIQKDLIKAKVSENQKLAQIKTDQSENGLLIGQATMGPVSPEYLNYTLDKLDIHEELSRFADHAQNLIKVINSANLTKGKQIDFILQECTREINTMSAKANNSIISALAIEIKVEIEKAREQVQNIV